MRFHKINLTSKTEEGPRRIANSGPSDPCKPSTSNTSETSFSEIRKSLDLLADVFSDLPDLSVSHATPDQTDAENEVSNRRIPISASEMLQLLSKGGMNKVSNAELSPNVAKDIDWVSSEALLQLVHTDHPYLLKSQEADDIQLSPTRSGSCSSIPDAELIHDFFLHTTNMISYQPLAEVGSLPVQNTTPTLIGCPQPPCRQHSETQACGSTKRDTSISGEPTDKHVGGDSKMARTNCGPDSGHGETEHNPSSSCVTEPSVFVKESETHETNSNDSHRNADSTTCLNANAKDMRENDHKPDSDSESQKDEQTKRNESNSAMVKKDPCTDKRQNISQKDESSVFSNMVRPSSLNQIDPDYWTAACKAIADKVEEDSLIQCAVTLLVKVWTDYLSLTFEEVRQLEIQAARENNFTDEVIEMIEDGDRYVWQIIEEMEPRNFSLNI